MLQQSNNILELLLLLPMPWRAILIIIAALFSILWFIFYCLPCLVAVLLWLILFFLKFSINFILFAEYLSTRSVRILKNNPPLIFYYSDNLLKLLTILQEKKSIRPKKLYAIPIFVILSSILFFTPFKESIRLLSYNGMTLWNKITKYKSIHTVCKGDSLSKIAYLNRVTVKSIVSANIKSYPALATEPDRLKIGWKLKIPTETNHR